LKPGKPLWFGVYRSTGASCLVFGLPGNPVSSLVCCELFVRPAMSRLAGKAELSATRIAAQLSRDFMHRGDRPTYHPARLTEDEGGVHIDPLKWQGSADLRTLASANALIHFASGDRQWRSGEMVEVLPL
jgi:molybdopterin molybdotransferase